MQKGVNDKKKIFVVQQWQTNQKGNLMDILTCTHESRSTQTKTFRPRINIRIEVKSKMANRQNGSNFELATFSSRFPYANDTTSSRAHLFHNNNIDVDDDDDDEAVADDNVSTY